MSFYRGSAEEVGSPGGRLRRFCLPEGGPAPAGSRAAQETSDRMLGSGCGAFGVIRAGLDRS